MIRAFLGLPLPDDVRAALVQQQSLLPLPRRVEPEQLHLTLTFLGEVPEPVLLAAHEAFCALRMAPFSISLQGLGLFGGARPRTLWVGVARSEALAALHAKTDRAARLAGCEVAARRFHPHVTLGRFPPPPGAEARRLERAVAAWAGQHYGEWIVSEMCLWQSRLTPKGPIYDVLAEYPFD